jgi:hypothetical protein
MINTRWRAFFWVLLTVLVPIGAYSSGPCPTPCPGSYGPPTGTCSYPQNSNCSWYSYPSGGGEWRCWFYWYPTTGTCWNCETWKSTCYETWFNDCRKKNLTTTWYRLLGCSTGYNYAQGGITSWTDEGTWKNQCCN